MKKEKGKRRLMKKKNINPDESKYIPEDKKKQFEELRKSKKKTGKNKEHKEDKER